ncbi:hypothetical protein FS842_001570 [Serendipita sp. 407]|nr:hypothetical protein FS842_001570 [Serendipita sp. 407]
MVPNSIRLFMEKNRDSEQKVKAQGELTSSRDERHGCLQHMGASVNPMRDEKISPFPFPLSLSMALGHSHGQDTRAFKSTDQPTTSRVLQESRDLDVNLWLVTRTAACRK